MKNTRRCPKCNSERVGHLPQLPDQAEVTGSRLGSRIIGSTTEGGFLVKRVHHHGEVHAYVCTECGYFEEYVDKPGEVPWEKLEGFRWLNAPSSDQPFR